MTRTSVRISLLAMSLGMAFAVQAQTAARPRGLDEALSRLNAEQSTLNRRADGRRREPRTRGLRRTDAEQYLGAWLAHAVEEIFNSVNLAERIAECARVRLELVEIVTEQLDLDRTGRACQVVDHIGEDLDKFDVQTRNRGSYFPANLIDDFEDAARTPGLRYETRDQIASILLRCEQPQLGAGPTRGSSDLGSLCEDFLRDVDLAIGLGERGSAGGEIIEHKCSFVHLRKKSSTGVAGCYHAKNHQRQGARNHDPNMLKYGHQRPLVQVRKRIETVRNPAYDAASLSG